MHTMVKWSDQLQAHIRVEVPGTRGYDKHFREFVDAQDEVRHCHRMADSQARQARDLKHEARARCREARRAKKAANRGDAIRHLSKAVECTRRAHRVGEQARLNRSRAHRLAAELGDTVSESCWAAE